MKRMQRILLAIGCCILLIVSWVIVLGAKSNSEKQVELITQAAEYIDDKVYILAIPLLEEAAMYSGKYTQEAETRLKKTYLMMSEQREYQRKYTSLLETLMNRQSATKEVFIEAATFYFDHAKPLEALTALKLGISKTGSEELITLYEANRYLYRIGNNAYDNVSAIFGTTIGVEVDGQWGLATSNGTLVIPTEYEKISTYSIDRTIVRKDGEIFAVDSNGNRLALLKVEASDFSNYAEGRTSILTNEGWKQATGKFELGSMLFDEIGLYFNGYAAAKQDGKWGIIDLSFEWLISPEYDGIMMDELGRAYAQEAVFVKTGNLVNLIVEGQQVGDSYEDAKPFDSEGYAAVKKNGKWGFIDTTGEQKIDYQFEEAISFGQHLAAVKQGEFWGYINRSGDLVIEPLFLQAKSFANGSAPVLTERGWQFITLLEFEKGVGL